MSTTTQTKDNGGKNARPGSTTAELSETAHTQTDRLAGAAHEKADRFASAAHETIDKVSDAAGSAEQKVRDKAARATEQAQIVQEEASEALDQGLDRVKEYVRTNPVMSAGIAFAAGFVVSALMRR
jgi:ElaB/YqjD/DUF883 family membrane-anchored ribosome-binding protein